MPARRVVIVQEEYRVIRRGPPSTPPRPPKKGGGGGWLVAGAVVGALVVIGNMAGGASHSGPAAPTGRQVVIEADSWNQCWLDVRANGEKFRMLGDSGAAGVYFSIKDARRLGYNPARLSFDHTYQGWGWKAKGATVRLRSLEIAGLTFNDVEAAIDELGSAADEQPLLGTPILKALNFQVRKGSCALTVPASARPGSGSDSPSYKPGERREMERLIQK
jgi:clan AA aspartic protease (TIGR02281 family)